MKDAGFLATVRARKARDESSGRLETGRHPHQFRTAAPSGRVRRLAIFRALFYPVAAADLNSPSFPRFPRHKLCGSSGRHDRRASRTVVMRRNAVAMTLTDQLDRLAAF